MKIAHLNKDVNLSVPEKISQGKAAEASGDLLNAAQIYEQIISGKKFSQPAFDRLMIVYRKQKEFAKELKTINRGIQDVEEIFQQSRKPNDKKVSTLSRNLMKMMGLADKQGRSLYEPEPLPRWRKRKAWVLKKLSKEK